jgi:hypothetical protein
MTREELNLASVMATTTMLTASPSFRDGSLNINQRDVIMSPLHDLWEILKCDDEAVSVRHSLRAYALMRTQILGQASPFEMGKEMFDEQG